MNSLVEKLREEKFPWHQHSCLLHDAADEIERIELLSASLTDDNVQLLSHNQRLRKALQEFGEHQFGCEFTNVGDGSECTCGLDKALELPTGS